MYAKNIQTAGLTTIAVVLLACNSNPKQEEKKEETLEEAKTPVMDSAAKWQGDPTWFMQWVATIAIAKKNGPKGPGTYFVRISRWQLGSVVHHFPEILQVTQQVLETGRNLLPPMPWFVHRNLIDEDIRAYGYGNNSYTIFLNSYGNTC